MKQKYLIPYSSLATKIWFRKKKALIWNNRDHLWEAIHINTVNVTDGWAVHNKVKRHFDEEKDGSDDLQIRILAVQPRKGNWVYIMLMNL